MNECSISLERILGLTTLNNSTLLSLRSNSIVYVAGCIAVLQSVDDRKQKKFFQVRHAISCLSVSSDEAYLAVGERGHNPRLVVFELSTGRELASLEMHKHGIGCAAFSPNGQFLVSASFKVDKQLCIWDWKSGNCLSSQKISNKVNSISFDISGSYFVTCGDKHLKWWHMQLNAASKFESVQGAPAGILDTHSQSNFVDMVILPQHLGENNVFVITSGGMLCMFSSVSRTMIKWVQIEVSSSYCLSFHSTGVDKLAIEYLFVGCENGSIRCFNIHNLSYVTTLPLPAPLSFSKNAYNLDDGSAIDVKIVHPACTGIRIIKSSFKRI